MTTSTPTAKLSKRQLAARAAIAPVLAGLPAHSARLHDSYGHGPGHAILTLDSGGLEAVRAVVDHLVSLGGRVRWAASVGRAYDGQFATARGEVSGVRGWRLTVQVEVPAPHAHSLVESGLTDECDHACKVFRCSCGETEVRHFASYGCPIGRAEIELARAGAR